MKETFNLNQERKPSLAEGYEAEIDNVELAQDLELETMIALLEE